MATAELQSMLNIAETDATEPLTVKLYKDGSVTLLQNNDIICLSGETIAAVSNWLFNRVSV